MEDSRRNPRKSPRSKLNQLRDQPCLPDCVPYICFLDTQKSKGNREEAIK